MRSSDPEHEAARPKSKRALLAWAAFSLVAGLALAYYFAMRGQPTTGTVAGDAAPHGNVAPVRP